METKKSQCGVWGKARICRRATRVWGQITQRSSNFFTAFFPETNAFLLAYFDLNSAVGALSSPVSCVFCSHSPPCYATIYTSIIKKSIVQENKNLENKTGWRSPVPSYRRWEGLAARRGRTPESSTSYVFAFLIKITHFINILK